jgi:hypothetical protein
MKAEGFQQAIVRTQVQALHSFVHVAPAGQHQHHGVVEPAAHLRQHLRPVFPRKAQVEHNQIRTVLCGMNQRRLTIPNPAHLMALELQSLLQKQAERRIIFDNQNSHFLSPKAEKPSVPQITLPIRSCV